jgi:hypothetical protein
MWIFLQHPFGQIDAVKIEREGRPVTPMEPSKLIHDSVIELCRENA